MWTGNLTNFYILSYCFKGLPFHDFVREKKLQNVTTIMRANVYNYIELFDCLLHAHAYCIDLKRGKNEDGNINVGLNNFC